MGLEVQIQSLIYSFVYGLFFSFLLNLNYHYIFESNFYVKIVVSLLFVVDNAFLYFILLKLINHGVLHPYFILLLFLGYLVGNVNTRVLRRFFLLRPKKVRVKKVKNKKQEDKQK